MRTRNSRLVHTGDGAHGAQLVEKKKTAVVDKSHSGIPSWWKATSVASITIVLKMMGEFKGGTLKHSTVPLTERVVNVLWSTGYGA